MQFVFFSSTLSESRRTAASVVSAKLGTLKLTCEEMLFPDLQAVPAPSAAATAQSGIDHRDRATFQLIDHAAVSQKVDDLWGLFFFHTSHFASILDAMSWQLRRVATEECDLTQVHTPIHWRLNASAS